jgi:hypothetical protein
MFNKIRALLILISHATDSWKKFLMTTTLLLMIGGGALVYQISYLYLTGNTEYYTSLAKRLKADDKITPVMETYRERINSDRLIVAELHDGKKNTTGVRFAYMSGTYEADDKGMTRVLMDFQNIPTSIFAGMWTPLLNGECVLVAKTAEVVSIVAQTQFEEYGSRKTYMCPVMSPADGTMIGVLLATWRDDHSEMDMKSIDTEMKRASYIVSGLIYDAKD